MLPQPFDLVESPEPRTLFTVKWRQGLRTYRTDGSRPTTFFVMATRFFGMATSLVEKIYTPFDGVITATAGFST
jgi:hypothetical protein